jgi:ketosteroid isomerase-like protein
VRKLLILIAGITLLSGCGGGGGSKTPPTATGQVQSRGNALDAATISGDTSRIAGFYSDAYAGPEGQTKAEALAGLTEMLNQLAFVSITTLSETFTISEDGSEVLVAGSYQFVLRNKETGETGTFQADGSSIWKKEGETWRIISTDSSEVVQVAQALRKK